VALLIPHADHGARALVLRRGRGLQDHGVLDDIALREPRLVIPVFPVLEEQGVADHPLHVGDHR